MKEIKRPPRNKQAIPLRLPRWRDLRLRTKILSILLTAMVVVCVCVFAVIRIPYSQYDNLLYLSSVRMIRLFANGVQSSLEEIEAISFRILADTSLQENLSIMKEATPGSVNWITARDKVAGRIGYYALTPPHTLTLQLKTAGGTTFSQSFGRGVVTDGLTAQRMERALGHNGREVWLSEGMITPQLYLVREVREIKGLTLDTLAVMLMRVDMDGLIEDALDSMRGVGAPISCAVYYDDLCLYASDDAIAALPVGESGYTSMRISGKDYLCVRDTDPNGWRYVTLTDYSDLRTTLNSAAVTAAAAVILTALIALALSSALIASILVHLKRLLDKVDAFAATGKPILKKDMRYQNRRDEISRLHRHFDRMTLQLDKMAQESALQQNALQEKQYRQLQAQVRPHFLFNTLQAIYSLAKTSADTRIADMAEALGNMLRTTLSDKRDAVTIAEDIQTAREYLRIQLIRYGERLSVEFDVDDSITSCQIPSMTVQPLVENAIHHAAEEMDDVCCIQISVKREGNSMVVSVQDNGPGMDEDMLGKLERGEAQAEGLGIGLRNIHKRIQYLFPGNEGLCIDSNPGCTRISLRVPLTAHGEQAGILERGAEHHV